MGTQVDTIRSGTDWLPVEDAAATGTARRSAMRLASRLGLVEARVAEVGIVASEAASNLYRHASQGTFGLQVALRDGRPGVQILAVDRGPGMADLERSSQDGSSTRGSLGVGIGAMQRLSTTFELSSQPGTGTVVVAGLWSREQVLPGGIPAHGTIDVGGVTRPIQNEQVCGDAIAGREEDGHHLFMVADGLGHGPLAAAASQEALTVFHHSSAADPLALLNEIHGRIRHTRGVAAAIVAIDPEFRRLRMAGLGNISSHIDHGGHRKGMPSYPGIVGHQARTWRQLDFDLDDDDVVVLHSDGVSESWDLRATPGLRRRSATTIAASLLRDAGSRRDDASILVARRQR